MRSDGETGPGLTRAEARARLETAGPNRLVEPPAWARLREALRVLQDPMALMLAVAATAYFLLGKSRDGVVLLVALVPVLGVDVILQARSRRALARLAERVASPAVVIREGREQDVPADEVVPGDLLVLREGSIAHADGVLRVAANLAMDEAPLTGESLPQEKRAAQGPDGSDDERFYAGTLVLAGHGVGLVEATGPATRYGRIGRLTAEAAPSSTPLQRSIARAVRSFAIGAVMCSLAVAVLVGARGGTLEDALVAGISLAIAAVPEEFPLVFTLFLSVGAWRLARHGVLARRLASVEALGSTTVICVDKTGTLTRGRFALTDHVPLDPGTTAGALLEASVLACERTPQDPLEREIVDHATEHGCDVAALLARWDLVRDHDFDLTGRHMTHAWRTAGGAEWIVAKGAFEGIVEHCLITTDARTAAEQAHAALASGGARVLAVAGKREHREGRERRDDDERDLTLYGLLGFEDPVRPEVARAVSECRSAGIHVVLVTGDHALTAHAVARAAGIADERATVLTGIQLDRMAESDLVSALRTVRVLARVRPEQKSLVVDALRRAGEVVAMTGDGINDAPALRRADIGVSMGPGATEVAREAAGLVLLENDFRGLVAAVREGRTIFLNLQRAFLYLVSFHVPVIALSFVPLMGLPPLLLPIHLVWLELIVHPVSALAFEGEPPPWDVMQRPPRNRRAAMLPAAAVLRTAATGAVVSAAALLRYGTSLDEGTAHARTAALAVVLLSSVLLVWAERAVNAPWWSLPWPRRRRFWIVMALVAGSLPLLSAMPEVAAALDIVPMRVGDWALSGLLAVLAVGWRAPGTRAARGVAPAAPRG